jgi:hypothetical protein
LTSHSAFKISVLLLIVVIAISVVKAVNIGATFLFTVLLIFLILSHKPSAPTRTVRVIIIIWHLQRLLLCIVRRHHLWISIFKLYLSILLVSFKLFHDLLLPKTKRRQSDLFSLEYEWWQSPIVTVIVIGRFVPHFCQLCIFHHHFRQLSKKLELMLLLSNCLKQLLFFTLLFVFNIFDFIQRLLVL